jgi:ArsR family transcriptional regulator
MPRLTATQTTTRTPTVEFVFSPTLDLLNAMYFTHLILDSEGVEGWPVELRQTMAPDLLSELDFLYEYPAGDPAVMGILGEVVFAHREVWDSAESLASYIRALPDAMGESEAEPGIHGLIYQAIFKYPEPGELAPFADMPDRAAVEARMRSLGDRDADAVMALYDLPAELRERMARLVERFWEEYYRDELPKRRAALERSAALHAGETREQAIETMKRLSSRPTICLEDGVCAGPYQKLVFAPSLDMGPYMSCADIPGDHAVHGTFYPCAADGIADAGPDAADTQRLARIYKALSDEQRLRILHMLREREMYVQEIVDRMDLHQSVVSRHLMFLKAVGLVQVRKENNMKHYSLNPEITGELSKTLDLFAGPSRAEAS